jgi:hypothetical protein
MRNINPDNILSDSIVTVYSTNLCQGEPRSGQTKDYEIGI